MPVLVNGNVVSHVAFVRTMLHVPVRTLQIVLKAGPYYFSIGNVGAQFDFDPVSARGRAIGDFLDDAILTVLEVLDHRGKQFVAFISFCTFKELGAGVCCNSLREISLAGTGEPKNKGHLRHREGVQRVYAGAYKAITICRPAFLRSSPSPSAENPQVSYVGSLEPSYQ